MKTLYLQEMMKEEMRAERELVRNSQNFAIFLDSRIGTDIRRLLHDKQGCSRNVAGHRDGCHKQYF